MKKMVCIVPVLMVLFQSVASACNVPVFRYALERWRPDIYEAVVFHEGIVSAADSALVQQLANTSIEPYNANLRTSLANVKDSLPEWVRNVWATQKPSKLPWTVLCLPGKLGHKQVWAGVLTSSVIPQIVQSPVRREATNRILRGESAVWIMIQSADRAKDKAASDTLQRAIQYMNDSLALPKPDGNTASYINVSGKVPLQVRFSTLSMSLSDPAEQVFLKMLLGPKVDPAKLTGPAICILFGRGRNLEVLTGSQITGKTLRQIGQFITGMCSCTIKEANPGTDMLISVNWDGALAGSLTPEPMPELTGMTTMGDGGAIGDTVKSAPNDTAVQKRAPVKKKK